MAYDWTDKQLTYMKWLTKLPEQRLHRTRAELADALGISERQLYNWQNEPGWSEAVQAMSMLEMLEWTPELFNAIKRAILIPDLPGRSQLLAFYMRYVLPAITHARDTGIIREKLGVTTTAKLPTEQANKILAKHNIPPEAWAEIEQAMQSLNIIELPINFETKTTLELDKPLDEAEVKPTSSTVVKGRPGRKPKLSIVKLGEDE